MLHFIWSIRGLFPLHQDTQGLDGVGGFCDSHTFVFGLSSSIMNLLLSNFDRILLDACFPSHHMFSLAFINVTPTFQSCRNNLQRQVIRNEKECVLGWRMGLPNQSFQNSWLCPLTGSILLDTFSASPNSYRCGSATAQTFVSGFGGGRYVQPYFFDRKAASH